MKNTAHLIPFSEHGQLSELAPPEIGSSIVLDTHRLSQLVLWGCFDNINFGVTPEKYDTQPPKKITGTPPLKTVTVASDHGRADFVVNCLSSFHTNPILTIDLNRASLNEHIQTKKQTPDSRAWARGVNRAIGELVRKAVWGHVASPHHPQEAVIAATQFLSVSATSLLFGNLGVTAATFGAFSVAFNTVMAAKHPRHLAEDRCHSLLPAFHIDRATAVSGLSRLLPIVRPIKATD